MNDDLKEFSARMHAELDRTELRQAWMRAVCSGACDGRELGPALEEGMASLGFHLGDLMADLVVDLERQVRHLGQQLEQVLRALESGSARPTRSEESP